MTTSPDYDGPVYVGVEQDEPELVDADVDEGPVPAAGEREEVRVPPVDWALAAYLGDNEDEGYPHPAPSVVRAVSAIEEDTVSDHHWSDEEWAAYEQGVIAASKKGDARVAAAVAAVRADLAVKLETLLEAAERIGFDHSGESPDCAACETYTAAAAVRSATKETTP